jgi:hypothetical protein
MSPCVNIKEPQVANLIHKKRSQATFKQIIKEFKDSHSFIFQNNIMHFVDQ